MIIHRASEVTINITYQFESRHMLILEAYTQGTRYVIKDPLNGPMWYFVGLCMNHETSPTTYIMSGRVCVR